MRYLEISKHSSISPNDLINSINKANLTPPLQVLYNNHNDVFYFEFAHSIDAIEALKWCDKWVRLVGGSNGDQVQSQVHSEQYPQPHSLNQHSSSGPPVGSILNPLIVTHSDPISPPLSPKSPKSPNSSLSTFNASPPQNLFDVLASLPGANTNTVNTVNTANTTQSIHTPHRTQTPNNSLPPILNTGSQGPMQMQPGDWVCSCGFVNWRRRKSCYRCYPFANGNESGSGNNGELARAAQKAAQLAEEGLSESQDNQDIHNTQDTHNSTHNDSAFAFDTHLLNVGLGRLELNQLDHHPHHPEHPTLDYRTFLASRKAWDSGNDGGFNGGGGGGSVGVDHNAHDTFDQLGEILQRVQSSR